MTDVYCRCPVVSVGQRHHRASYPVFLVRSSLLLPLGWVSLQLGGDPAAPQSASVDRFCHRLAQSSNCPESNKCLRHPDCVFFGRLIPPKFSDGRVLFAALGE